MTLDKDVLDESAGGNEHAVFMAKIDNLSYDSLGHEAKRTAGELERINVASHCFEKVFEMASAVSGVIGPADFG